MHNTTHEHVDIYDEHDNLFTVTFAIHPGLRATRDRYGAPESPDDEPEVEFIGATDEDSNSVDIPDSLIAAALEELSYR